MCKMEKIVKCEMNARVCIKLEFAMKVLRAILAKFKNGKNVNSNFSSKSIKFESKETGLQQLA